jgi:hypothetical protein
MPHIIIKDFSCTFPDCGKFFRSDLGLKKHQRIVHSNWDPEVDKEGQFHLLVSSCVCMTANHGLDPLPYLYTLFSDKLESEDQLSVPAHRSDSDEEPGHAMSG